MLWKDSSVYKILKECIDDTTTKEVSIHKPDKSFVCGGLMTLHTLIDKVVVNAGDAVKAKELWDEATEYSLSDFCGNIVVRVRIPI